MPTLYQFCATIVKVTEYDDNGKPVTRILQWSPVTGLIAVVFVDAVTCGIMVYWLIATVYMSIIRIYLASVFTEMGNVISFAEMFIIAFTMTTCMFTAVIMRALMPVYGPYGSPYANVLTLAESAWNWIYRSH